MNRPRQRRAILLALCGLGLCASALGCRQQPRGGNDGHADRLLPVVGVPRFVDPATGEAIAASELAVDFGRVRLETEERREVRLRNDGAATFTVLGLTRAEGFPDSFGYPTSPFNVGPGEETAFVVAFHPTASGDASGSLRLTIENGAPAALALLLHGTGFHAEAGPELALAPTQLDFPDVEVFTSLVRTLTLANNGGDVSGTTADNLRFGVLGDDGVWVERAPAIVGPNAADFIVDWPPQGYGPDGLSEAETVEVRVRFYPRSEGDKEAALIIASNDPRRPEVPVQLAGRGIPSTGCDLDVSPRAIDFGTIDDGVWPSRLVTVTNRDPRRARFCRIALIDLSPETKRDGAFNLGNGAIAGTWIAGGEAITVPVGFGPPLDGPFSGELEIAVEGSTGAPTTVELHAISANPCLWVDQPELKFAVERLQLPGPGGQAPQRLQL